MILYSQHLARCLCGQFIDRILLIFKPAKYQPDATYLRHVPIKRVHIFTAIQVVCLIVLWVIKSVKSVSIIFPIMVSGLVNSSNELGCPVGSWS